MAALGMVFALGLSGTALAANRTWMGGGGDKKWGTAANWDSGIPGTGDKAIIIASADVEVDGPAMAQVVDLAEGAKLTLNAKLELDNGGALSASGNATVTSKAAGVLKFTTTNNVIVSAGKTLTLAAEGAGLSAGAFHSKTVLIPELKRYLRERGVPVRIEEPLEGRGEG